MFNKRRKKLHYISYILVKDNLLGLEEDQNDSFYPFK